MKAGYPQAAWRLFQRRLEVPAQEPREITWAEAELCGTPFGGRAPLPILRPRGVH